MNDSTRRRRTCRTDTGFTVVELSISLAMTGILVAVGFGAFQQYAKSVTARKAAVQVTADVSLTRSFAIERRENVSLVVDESALTYEIRNEAGTILGLRDFSNASDLLLSALEINTSGDSLTFNSRGLMSTGAARIVTIRSGRSHRVDVNALGSATIN